MSVFAGDCSLAAAEQVCADTAIPADEVAGLLARLVDKSLVTAEPTADGVRFRLLATLAEYGRQRLVASGDNGAARGRHARWVASLVDVSGPDVRYGSWDRVWFETFKHSMDDIRLAMDWVLEEGDGVTALVILRGLASFWNLGGRIDDSWSWVTRALALDHPRTPGRVLALAMAAAMGTVTHLDDAIAYGAEAVELGRAAGHRRALAFAEMVHGGLLSTFPERRQRALALLEEATVLLEARGDDESMAMAALTHGWAALAEADLERAWPALRLAADRFVGVGNLWSAAVVRRQLADILVWRGAYDEAILALCQALSGLMAMGAVGMASAFTAQLGYVSSLQGRFEEADAWLAEALTRAEQQQDLPMLALAYNTRGLSLRRRNLLDDAEESHRRALALYHERRSPLGVASSLAALGYIAEQRHDAVAAGRHHLAGLDAASEIDNRRAQALALEGLAGVASLNNDAEAVGTFLGAAAALRESTAGMVFGAGYPLLEATGGRLSSAERTDVDRAIARLDDIAAMDAAFAEGQRDSEAVLAAARNRDEPPGR
jgi:tetratricopeptide (TPR) repeat protein